jgi:hypothetical protein
MSKILNFHISTKLKGDQKLSSLKYLQNNLHFIKYKVLGKNFNKNIFFQIFQIKTYEINELTIKTLNKQKTFILIFDQLFRLFKVTKKVLTQKQMQRNNNKLIFRSINLILLKFDSNHDFSNYKLINSLFENNNYL